MSEKSIIFSLHEWLEGTHWCDRCNNWKVQIQTSEITDSMVLTVSGPYKVTLFTKYTTVLPLSICTYLHTQHNIADSCQCLCKYFLCILVYCILSQSTIYNWQDSWLQHILNNYYLSTDSSCTTCYIQTQKW